RLPAGRGLPAGVRGVGLVSRRVDGVPRRMVGHERRGLPEEGGQQVTVTRAEVCVTAIAECFRGDGELLANPIGTIPMIGGRLARASFEPDLLMTGGEAMLIANDEAFAWPNGKVVEYYNSYRSMFDVVWAGKRHVIM